MGKNKRTAVKSFKVRLYPNKTQEQELIKILGACRFVFNHFLEIKKNYYETMGKNISYAQTARDLTLLRRNTDWLSNIQAEPLHQSLRRLDRAYQSFFRKISSLPRFKTKKDVFQSFQKHAGWLIRDNKIQVQKDLMIRFRGSIDLKAELGTLVVSRTFTGKWYATIFAKVLLKKPKYYSKPIGIDVGIETLATLSTGQKFPNFRPGQKLSNKLSEVSRSFSRKKKGSNRRQKAKVELARVHEKIANVRRNYLHQVSNAIVSKNHAMIAIEDLNVKGMVRNHKLARALIDASISELLRQIQYKQLWKGGKIVKIGRFVPSSKTCSFCDFVAETMPLSVRKWQCPKCKKNHDRDINAAKVILKYAVAHTARREAEKVSKERITGLVEA